MKKQPEKTAQTQASLTAAFWDLYKAKPIEKITVKEITDRAGVYRSTFYLYFTDVYYLLEQIENDILFNWENMVDEILKHGSLEVMLDMLTAFYEKYGEYLSVLLSPAGDPTFLQKIKDTLRPKMLSILQLSENDVEVTLIFEFFISAVLAFLTGWYRNGKQISAREAVALIRSLVSEGITSVMLRHTDNERAKRMAELFAIPEPACPKSPGE